MMCLTHFYPIKDGGKCWKCFEEKKPAKQSKAKPKAEIKKVSAKQAKLNREIKKTRPEVMQAGKCSGCGKPEGAVILDDSHLISRDYCRDYSRFDLYTDVRNRRPHCKTLGNHKGCHDKWESNAERHTLLDYKPNMAFIKSELPEVARIMLMNESEALKKKKVSVSAKPPKREKALEGVTTDKEV